MIPIKCLTSSGYYEHYEAFKSALNIGYNINDIKHSIIKKVSVDGRKWFLKNESDLGKLKDL